MENMSDRKNWEEAVYHEHEQMVKKPVESA